MNRQERRRLGKGAVVDVSAQLAQGVRRYRGGDLAGAEVVFRQILLGQPGHNEATRLLGELLADTGRLGESIAVLQRLAAAHPRDFVAAYSLANACRMAGQYQAAMAAYQACLAIKPDFAGALHGLGACYRNAEREAEALECFRQAARAMPGWAVVWKDMGVTLAMLGDMPLAEAALERAVQLDPGLGDAQRHLAAVRRGQAGAGEMAELERKCADAATPQGEKIEMLFALGGLQDKAGDYEAAFRHFSAANALLRAQYIRAGRGFDRAKLTHDVNRLTAAFTPEIFAQYAGLGDASEAPVFILGMPRAGSTLFEQIAASHSCVFGAGERFGIGAAAAKLGQMPNDKWTKEGLREQAGLYLAGLRAQAGNVARIIDKMPDNIFMLGLIAAMFPNARIIFCARDARDVALSCFFQNFAQPMAFDTDLADCALRIRETDRLTRHWQQVLPLRHITLSYEALLADLAGESRRLIAFLGLEWEEQCLNFHATQRPVRTASWAQVRQPLYQHSAGRWRHYEKQLEGIEF